MAATRRRRRGRIYRRDGDPGTGVGRISTEQRPPERRGVFTQHIDELLKDGAASESAAPPSPGRRSLPAADVANSAEPPRDVSATGELSSEFLDPDSSPGATRKLPGSTGAGSGLEDGPTSPFAPDGAIPRPGDAPDAGQPLLIPPGDPAAPGQVRPGHEEGPSGPVP